MLALLKGIIIGFAITVPVGPVALLCARKVIVEGRKAGLVSAFGASLGDGMFALFAGISSTAFTAFLLSQKSTIQLFGIVIIFIISLRILATSKRSVNAEEIENKLNHRLRFSGLIGTFFTSFFLILTNPMTLIAFILAMNVMDIQRNLGANTIALASIGIFIGASLWWFILVFITDYVKHRFHLERVFGKINTAVGYLLLIISLASFVSVLDKLFTS